MNRHLYTIKQGTQEGVTEFAMRLCCQIRAIQEKYSGEILEMEESEIKRVQFLGGLKPELQAIMAYTKETGVDGKRADYGQLLRIAQQLENEAKANKATPHSYGSGLLKKALAHGVSARVTDIQEEDNIEVQTCTDECKDKIGAHPDLDESFLGVLIHMTKVVQHYEKVEKRCFVCDDPSLLHQGLLMMGRIPQ